MEVEARYVETFDRGRATSLHLFEHVHGDSRDRGPAMIDLVQTYEKAGLYLGPEELPDHLCVVLEFASTQPPALARAFLGEMAHILQRHLQRPAQAREPLRRRAWPPCWSWPARRPRPCRFKADEPLDESLGRARGLRRLRHRGQNRRASRSPSTSSARTPTLSQGAQHELPHNFLFGYLSLHLPDGLPAGQPDPLRPRPVQLEERFLAAAAQGQLRWGSNLFHVGILFLFFGHTVGMLTPHFVYEPFMTAGAKQLMAMVSAACSVCWASSA
jgi:nitrate reductase molybdenum cofactor assembly chaperone NarJ/NarW